MVQTLHLPDDLFIKPKCLKSVILVLIDFPVDFILLGRAVATGRRTGTFINQRACIKSSVGPYNSSRKKWISAQRVQETSGHPTPFN